MWLYYRVKSPNDAYGMANSVDPDQTAPLGAVWSGSALFAQEYLSENLGSLWYKFLAVTYISMRIVVTNYSDNFLFNKSISNLVCGMFLWRIIKIWEHIDKIMFVL